MTDENHLNGNEGDYVERRVGSTDRRNGLSDPPSECADQRLGPPDRRINTHDVKVTVVTSSGEYSGTINLNASCEQADRTSDFLIKGNPAFLTLYNAVLVGQPGEVIFINFKDIALVLPKDGIFPDKPELREDARITVNLKYGLGKIKGMVNLLGEDRHIDRVSDLLNYPRKKWLVVYDAECKGKHVNVALINLDFVSSAKN
jgi:hypothetical protein